MVPRHPKSLLLLLLPNEQCLKRDPRPPVWAPSKVLGVNKNQRLPTGR